MTADAAYEHRREKSQATIINVRELLDLLRMSAIAKS